jgi:hypothetical protein
VATASPEAIAAWMLEQFQKHQVIYQHEVAYEISERFGEPHVYVYQNGNLGISRDVLGAFRGLTEQTAVWSRGERCWRIRQDFDEPGRRQE